MDTLHTGLGPEVAVDECHLNLVYGLIVSQKPSKILEIGVGSGDTTRTIVRAAQYNENKPNITLVDNWLDFGGKPPSTIENFKSFCNVISSDERSFVFDTRETYDFIFSDADHWNTDKWFDYVFDRLLNINGILIYHDVSVKQLAPSETFANLKNILIKCKTRGLAHMHFDNVSKPGERCYRGLLVIFKSQLNRVSILGENLLVSE